MMMNKFYEAYRDLFCNSINEMKRLIRIKIKAIKYYNKFFNNEDDDFNDNAMKKMKNMDIREMSINEELEK